MELESKWSQGSSNTAGTINTTYTSANTTAGFSIVSYTGNSGGSRCNYWSWIRGCSKMVMSKKLNGAY